ncbi:MAG TPA: metallophosphoesterase family protein [Kofleriaceae bacterium]|nr:metallophosphoesterase family protein [Kofleriaceae bacterium]
MTAKLLVAGLVLVCACDPNQSGNIGATKLGDVSHPATRKSPLEDLQTACGAGGSLLLGTSTMIQRRPYLQQVTSDSAIVGWVTDAPSGQTIEITGPDGKMVSAAAAAPEDAGARSAGEKQMWTTASGLQPDTVYCYRVLVNGVPASERIGFRTAPAATSTRPIGVLVFGDSGAGTSDQVSLRAQMDEVPYEVIIHTGDLAYESGTLTELEDTVFDIYDDLFRHIPFYPASGNHDYKTMDGAPFREVFKLPENGEDEKWYSYDWGRIHFATLDTEADYKTQVEWLDRDLAASTLPWKIIYLHRPPYSSGNHGSDMMLRKLLAPVLERHRVQLVLAGHDHNYERIVPQNGVTYIVTGGGGRGTYSVGTSSFTAFSEAVIHYVYLEVGVDELVMHAIDAEGTEFDSTVIPR